jgi:UDP-N-acetylmuramate dehydrogenase
MNGDEEVPMNMALATASDRAPGGGVLRGVMKTDEPMRRHTSWRVGGPAQHFYIPADIADLARFLQALPEDEPVYFVGLGSNLLVRDGGVRGTVILLHGALNQLALWHEKTGLAKTVHAAGVYAEAGVASPKLARFAALHGLEGAEFLAGVPGTVGGALAMNAGCYGGETWKLVAEVLTIDRRGELRRRLPAEFEIGYRHVVLTGEGGRRNKGETAGGEEWFVAAWFRLKPGDGDASRQKIKELLSKRVASQPLNLPNAGSVFRNPPGDHAARLIETCGLKGMRVGGAMVSPKHANFIVNAGGATAGEIEVLIEKVWQTVKDRTGVALVREVRIIGDAK